MLSSPRRCFLLMFWLSLFWLSLGIFLAPSVSHSVSFTAQGLHLWDQSAESDIHNYNEYYGNTDTNTVLAETNTYAGSYSYGWVKTNFGSHQAIASASQSTPDWTAVAHANSEWWDVWTITGGGYMMPGQLTVGVTLTGSITGSGYVEYSLIASGEELSITNNEFISGRVYYVTFPFLYGEPIQLHSELGLTAVGSQFISGVSFFGTLDFSSTAMLTQIILPEGATLTASSGISYPLNQVPLPSALWLLGSGLIGIIGIRKGLGK